MAGAHGRLDDGALSHPPSRSRRRHVSRIPPRRQLPPRPDRLRGRCRRPVRRPAGRCRWRSGLADRPAVASRSAISAALVGVVRGRDWGRNLAVFVAEIGGGLAILGAVGLLTGARPFGADASTGPGLVAWGAVVYGLLGIAAGRVPVVGRLTPIERRRVVFGPSFAGMAG